MIRRNTAGQVIYLPQLTTTDGTPITTGATLTVAKDGTEAASAGTLDHVADGVWKYTPTQSETDAAIVALILTASGAVPVVLNLVTTAANTAAVAFGANTTTPPTASANAAATRTELATELARIDVNISSRATPQDVSPTINFNPTIEPTPVTVNPTELSSGSIELIQSGLGTLAKQEEILAAIGDIEGGGGGDITGARTLSITVVDDDTDEGIEGARVRIYRTGADGTAVTDADGEVVMARDEATWQVTVAAAGYVSLATTLVVDGDEVVEYRLVSITFTPPPDPNTATLRVTCIGEDSQIAPGATVLIRMIEAPTGQVGFGYDGSAATFTADSNGVAEKLVIRGATYEIRREGTYKQWQKYVMPTDEALIEITSFVQP